MSDAATVSASSTGPALGSPVCAPTQRSSYWVILYDVLPVVIVGPFASNDLASSYGHGHQQGNGDDPRWQVLVGPEKAACARRLSVDGVEVE